MNYYNNFNGMGMPGNYQFNAYQQQDKRTPNMENALTKEQIKEVKNEVSVNELKIEVNSFDLIKNKCTHKENGGIVLYLTQRDGEEFFKCPICGKEFHMVNASEANKVDILNAFQAVIDVIESLKTVGVDLPISFLDDIAKLEAVLEMIPKIHETVFKNWYTKYESSSNGYNQASMSNPVVGVVDFIMNNNVGGYNPALFPQQPQQNILYGYMGVPQQGQYYQQQPYQYGQPQGGYQQYNPYGYMGNQQPYPQQSYGQPHEQLGGGLNNGVNPFYVAPPKQPAVDYAKPPVESEPAIVPPVQPSGGESKTTPSYQPPEKVVTKKVNP